MCVCAALPSGLRWPRRCNGSTRGHGGWRRRRSISGRRRGGFWPLRSPLRRMSRRRSARRATALPCAPATLSAAAITIPPCSHWPMRGIRSRRAAPPRSSRVRRCRRAPMPCCRSNRDRPRGGASRSSHRAQQARAGAVLLDQGHVLQPKDIGLLIALGIERVRVVRRPRVALVVAAPKAAVGPARDANEPMLQRLIARDGGMVAALATGVAGQAAMAAGMAAPEADLILVAGRSGTGGDDVAPAALAERGRLAIHGI